MRTSELDIDVYFKSGKWYVIPMTLIWLLIWWIQDNPQVDFSGDWNTWAVFLAVAIVLDVLYTIRSVADSTRR